MLSDLDFDEIKGYDQILDHVRENQDIEMVHLLTLCGEDDALPLVKDLSMDLDSENKNMVYKALEDETTDLSQIRLSSEDALYFMRLIVENYPEKKQIFRTLFTHFVSQ